MPSPLLLAVHLKLASLSNAEAIVRLGASNQATQIQSSRLRKEISIFSAFFQAAKIAKGDVVGMLAGKNSLWLPADLAIMSLGAASVCLDSHAGEAHWVEVLALCRSPVCLAETPAIAHALHNQAHRLPNLRCIVVLDSEFTTKRQHQKMPEIFTITEIFSTDQVEFGFELELSADDTAAVCMSYSHESDGRAVMWSHESVLKQALVIGQKLGLKPGTLIAVGINPESPFYRWICLAALLHGWVLLLVDNDTDVDSLKSMGATALFFDQLFWEKSVRLLSGPDRGGLGGLQFGKGFLAALYRSETALFNQKSQLRWILRIVRLIASQFGLFARRRHVFGDVAIAVVPQGSLAPAVMDNLALLGLRVFSIAGNPESGCVACGDGRYPNAPLRIFPGIGVEIRDSAGLTPGPASWGLVYVNGQHIMKGYLRQPLKTREILDRQGTVASGLAGKLAGDQVEIAGVATNCIQARDGKLVNIQNLASHFRNTHFFESVSIGLTAHGKLEMRLGIKRESLQKRIGAKINTLANGELLEHKRVKSLLDKQITSLFSSYPAIISRESCQINFLPPTS